MISMIMMVMVMMMMTVVHSLVCTLPPAQGETGCGLEGNRHHLQIQDDHSGVGDDVVGDDDDKDDDDIVV